MLDDDLADTQTAGRITVGGTIKGRDWINR